MPEESLLVGGVGNRRHDLLPPVVGCVDIDLVLSLHLGENFVLDDVDCRERNAAVVERLEKRERVGLGANGDVDERELVDLPDELEEAVRVVRDLVQKVAVGLAEGSDSEIPGFGPLTQ